MEEKPAVNPGFEQPKDYDGSVDDGEKNVFDEEKIEVTALFQQDNQGSNARHIECLDHKKSENHVRKGAPRGTVDPKNISSVYDCQIQAIAAFNDVDAVARDPHRATVHEARKLTICNAKPSCNSVGAVGNAVRYQIQRTHFRGEVEVNFVGCPHQNEGKDKPENKHQKGAVFVVKLVQRGRPVHERLCLQRYEGCFTFGTVRTCFPLLLLLLVVLRLGAQPVCVKPERIPAIRFALQVPNEVGVDRKGPWLLSEPVAVKYGLLLKGPVDERLDSSCAKFAAEAQWKKSMLLYQDSLLADIALAVSPSYAVRLAKSWRLDPCQRDRDLDRIRQAEVGQEWLTQPGWSQHRLLEARLLWTELNPVVAAAPARTAVVATTAVAGTDGSRTSISAGTSGPSSPTTGATQTTAASSSTPTNPAAPNPVPPKPTPQKIKYVVKSGDSLWKIAQKFPSTTEAELVRLNKGKTTIYPGQILWIPK